MRRSKVVKARTTCTQVTFRRRSSAVIETQPNIAMLHSLQASASGKPVVAFDAVGLRDVVVDGETGLLAQVGDVPALAAACKHLAENPAEAHAMGRAGRVRAAGHFGKATAVEAYIKLYRNLVR